jgi:flagellar basal body-associated protein FliL
MTITVIILSVLAILALLGLAVFPLMVATGLWARTTAQENRAQAQEIERLLAEPDR